MGRCYYKNTEIVLRFWMGFHHEFAGSYGLFDVSTIWRCKFHKVWLGENIIGCYNSMYSMSFYPEDYHKPFSLGFLFVTRIEHL